MQADWQSQSGTFAKGLLNPGYPVPKSLGHDPKRFGVYRNNVTVGLVNALELNFPAITRLVGKDFFRAMARDYAHAHPPKSPLMFEFGDELPEFIAAAPQLSGFPYLPDVATLEIGWRQSYHEADAPILQNLALAQMPPDQMFAASLIPHPALRLFKSGFPAASIMRANRTAEPAPYIPAIPELIIIARPSTEVATHVVENDLFTFVELLASGKSLGTAAEVTVSQFPAVNLSSLIASTLALAIFSSVEVH